MSTYHLKPVEDRVGAGTRAGNKAEAAAAAELRMRGFGVEERGVRDYDTKTAHAAQEHRRARHVADLSVIDLDPARRHSGRAIWIEVQGCVDGRVCVKLEKLLTLAENALWHDTRTLLGIWDQTSETVWYATLPTVGRLLTHPDVEPDVLDINVKRAVPKPCVWIPLNLLASWEVADTVKGELQDAYQASLFASRAVKHRQLNAA